MIDEVRQAFADALSVIDGLHVDPYIVEGIRAPHAMVDYQVAYDLTFARGSDAYEFVVMVFAQRSSAEQSQKLLDRLRDPSDASSVKQVLEGDAGLAALVDYVRVAAVDRPQVVTVGNADYLMVSFNCEVVI